MIQCQYCPQQIEDDSRFCRFCGRQVYALVQANPFYAWVEPFRGFYGMVLRAATEEEFWRLIQSQNYRREPRDQKSAIMCKLQLDTASPDAPEGLQYIVYEWFEMRYNDGQHVWEVTDEVLEHPPKIQTTALE